MSKLFCTHQWRLLSETTTKSQAEILTELGAENMRGSGALLRRKHIVVLACDSCGATKHLVTVV
jgi:hypothetical protein